MCPDQIKQGFCTHPECIYIHKEEEFAKIQEENGFCIPHAKGIGCEIGTQMCPKTHDAAARARIQMRNGVCYKEVSYECESGPFLCNYSHDLRSIE